jgi:SulP family sulfate permease
VLDQSEESAELRLPAGVRLYEINGPLFFGAAQSAMAAILTARVQERGVMILHLGKVPMIDATGLVALENAIASLQRKHQTVILAGPLPEPRHVFDRARLEERHPGLQLASSRAEAIELAERLVQPPSVRPPRPVLGTEA